MTFQEIFDEDGLYVSDSFREGAAFKINSGSLTLLSYKDKNDVLPYESNFPVYKGLFSKDFKKVYTRQSLFKGDPIIIVDDSNKCDTCVHDGYQGIYRSSCTGCCVDGGYKNYMKK